MKIFLPLLVGGFVLLAPFGLRHAMAQHHDHYRHHHHQHYDQVLADVQSVLGRAGLYHTRVDGIYGPESAHAIRSFQRSKGMPETGVIDGNLLAALGLGIPTSPGGSGVPGQQGGTVPQSAAGHQGAPSSTAPTQQTGVPPGYQLVPINPPAAAVSSAASPTPSATASPEATPIPNP